MNNKEEQMKSEDSENLKKLDPEEVRRVALEFNAAEREMSKVIFGQEEIIKNLFAALISKGHVLLEGVPGVAKTLLVRTLAHVCGCSFKRIQFTVDLLPSDIIGLTMYDPQRGFEIVKGPIFANFIIADEINRSPPKTQSAFMEAMQEKQVTIGKTTFPLPAPFFVMATQNPIENEGVYNLPEAQIDRFLFKLLVNYPSKNDEEKIMSKNISIQDFEDYGIKPILSEEKIIALQEMTKRVYLDEKIKKYIVELVALTRSKDFEDSLYIDLGCSPRASISLFIAAKAWALINGRNYVIPKDVQEVAPGVLRHRLILSFRARAEHISSDQIIERLIKKIKPF